MMRRTRTWTGLCGALAGLCVLLGRAEEVAGVRELTGDVAVTNLTGAGAFTCSAGEPVTLTLHNTQTSEFTGTIDGRIRVVKTGSGTLDLTSKTASTFSGGLEVAGGTYSQLAAVGSGPVVLRENGNLVFRQGGTLTNALTVAGAGRLGVWRNCRLTLARLPDLRKAKVTFTDGGTFFFSAPLTPAVAGETTVVVDKGILSLPQDAFGTADGLLVSSVAVSAGSPEGSAAGKFLSRLHARGPVTLPDLSLAGGDHPLTCDRMPVAFDADAAAGDPRTLAPLPAFTFNGRVAVTKDTTVEAVTLGLSSGAVPTELRVETGAALVLSNDVVRAAGAHAGGLVKTGAGALVFDGVLDVAGALDVLEGTVVFGAAAQTVAPATLGVVHGPSAVRFADGASAAFRFASGVHTGFLATAGIWFDAAAFSLREGVRVTSVPNFGAAGGAFSTAFAFGQTGEAPTFSAAGLAGKAALAFDGAQALALDSWTNTTQEITVFTVLQCDSYYPAEGRGLWTGFFSMVTPNAAMVGKYGEDEGQPGSLHTSFAQALDDTCDTVEKAFSRLSVRQGAQTLYTLDAQGRLPIGAPFLFAHRRAGASHDGALFWDAAVGEVTASGTRAISALGGRFFALGGRLTQAGAPNKRRMFAGKIGEMLVFDRALTAEETAFVKAYLKNKWFGASLAAELPAGAATAAPPRAVAFDVPAGAAHVTLAKAADAEAVRAAKTGAGRLGFADADGAARRLDVREGTLALAPAESAAGGKAVIWLDADAPDTLTRDAKGDVVAARNLGTAGGAFTLSTAQGGVPCRTDGGINGRRTLAFNGKSALALASYTNNNGAVRDLHLYGVFRRDGLRKWGGPFSFSCATDTATDQSVAGNFHAEDIDEKTVKLFFGTGGPALEGTDLFADGEAFLFVSHQGATWTANAFIRAGQDDLAATPWLVARDVALSSPRITLCQLGGRLKGALPQDGTNGTDVRLWAGELGEFIVFDRPLQAVEETALLGYLRRKWLGAADGPDAPPASLLPRRAAGRTHGGLDLALAPGTTLAVGVTNLPLASLALDGAAVAFQPADAAARGPLFALAGGAALTGDLSFATARFPSGGLTFFTYGTAVSGAPVWTLAGERRALMRARDDTAARRYVFAPPQGSAIFLR